MLVRFPRRDLRYAGPYPINEGKLAEALWALHAGVATVDQIWMARKMEQDLVNERRAESWRTRLKVLGPRPIDEQRDRYWKAAQRD